MINNVVLVGRLTKDPDLRYTASGSAVATFTLAVNRNFTNQNGDREADFINCVIWRKPAETMANYARKGTLLGVVGRIQTRNYENQQGQRVYVTEVVVDNFSLLESRAESEQRRAQSGSANNNFGGGQQGGNQGGFNAAPAQNPFGAPASNGNVFGGASTPAQSSNDPFGGGQEVDISDDDLPF